MSKLARYDKHSGSTDRAANDYFRHDYIYRKNLATRLAVGFGAILIQALYWLRIIFIDGVDLFEINLQQHIQDSVLFILAVLAVYTVIGTLQGTREYYLVQKRIKDYEQLVDDMERLNEREERNKQIISSLEDDEESDLPSDRRRRRMPSDLLPSASRLQNGPPSRRTPPRVRERQERDEFRSPRVRPEPRSRRQTETGQLVRRFYNEKE